MNQTVCYKQVLGRLWPGSRRLPRDNDSAQAALRVWSNETFRTTFKTEPFWIPRSTVHKGKWRKNSRHLKACAMETSAGRTIAKWCKMGNFQCKMWKDVKSINQKGAQRPRNADQSYISKLSKQLSHNIIVIYLYLFVISCRINNRTLHGQTQNRNKRNSYDLLKSFTCWSTSPFHIRFPKHVQSYDHSIESILLYTSSHYLMIISQSVLDLETRENRSVVY